jgi:hypothetical protein
MNIVLSIPSGQRAKKLVKVIEEWRNVCNFKIAVYTWCEETKKLVEDKVDYFWFGRRESFAFNHNFMANAIRDWDVYICGADDLYPHNAINQIEIICKKYPDKIICVKDGFLNKMITHPIVTRKWYDKYGNIFDEKFKHNFCDNDLFVRAVESGEIVSAIEEDVSFEHRHPLKTNEPIDEIYEYGNRTYAEDREYYNRKNSMKRAFNASVEEIPKVHL